MRLHVYDVALRVPFRGLSRRSGILFRGPAGWAEWSPFPEYGDEEAAAWLRAALEAAELGHPDAVRDSIEVNGIVPALAPGEAAARAVASGCRSIKIKVAERGQGLDDDVARVAAVRSALPEARIRVDANGGWSLIQARDALRELAVHCLEYAEQPCTSVEELARLRAMDLGVPIAADESIRRASDPLRVRDAGAADIAVLKVQPLGGVRACLRLAEEIGLPVVVSSAVETSVGLRAGVALAAALPELPYACGLETGRLLDGDVAGRPLLPKAGTIRVRDVEPEPELLERHAAGPELTRVWLDRWQRVRRVVEEGR
ncbi:o-succinylbenzoate synthase [Tessaracoccus sp. MC1679]|uniref:o-succinylbenzoate synthase n=1 Tax=Tessaracoccus sp. MC1679 TaxID=2760313 RepID=UPI0015FF3700|nr:o-succinylbenzoate synthase [Tessaracoccus sp. MC1679]MBB1516729.1 o-succinylbenzoate synthase [Tessaracoccus sp. MC1679]